MFVDSTHGLDSSSPYPTVTIPALGRVTEYTLATVLPVIEDFLLDQALEEEVQGDVHQARGIVGVALERDRLRAECNRLRTCVDAAREFMDAHRAVFACKDEETTAMLAQERDRALQWLIRTTSARL